MDIQAIRNFHKNETFELTQGADNLGLSFEKFLGCVEEHGAHFVKDKDLAIISSFRFDKKPNLKESYSYAFKQWKTALEKQENALCFDIVAISRVILGSGNASSLEVGLNLNKPWGVPYISGSSIKGVVSSFLRKTGPMDADSLDYVNIFGGSYGGKKYSGSVVFNDAWLYTDVENWFVPDIINPHYQKYYSGSRMPDGMENPVPVKTLALDSGLSFFVSMHGSRPVLEFLKQVMTNALEEYGIGAKTSVGYGRFKVVTSEQERIDLVKNVRRPNTVAPMAVQVTSASVTKPVVGGYRSVPSSKPKGSFPYETDAILCGKSKKGKWLVQVDGIANPVAVHNSEMIPEGCKDGDSIRVEVNSPAKAVYKG